MDKNYEMVKQLYNILIQDDYKDNDQSLSIYSLFCSIDKQLSKIRHIPKFIENKIKTKKQLGYSNLSVSIKFEKDKGIININDFDDDINYKIIKNFSSDTIYFENYDKTLRNIFKNIYYYIYLAFDKMEEYYNMLIKYNNGKLSNTQRFKNSYFNIRLTINEYAELIPLLKLEDEYRNVSNYKLISNTLNNNSIQFMKKLKIDKNEMNDMFSYLYNLSNENDIVKQK